MSAPHLVSRLALGDTPYQDRLIRLGRALVALSHDLAASRRTIVALERENRELREQLRRAARS
jgi:hypothetical protein